MYKEQWNYNNYSDPANANMQTVLNKLDRMLGGYRMPQEYAPPTIMKSDTYPFQYYANEDFDNIGKYFVEDEKTTITTYSDMPLSIDIYDFQMMPPVPAMFSTSV